MGGAAVDSRAVGIAVEVFAPSDRVALSLALFCEVLIGSLDQSSAWATGLSMFEVKNGRGNLIVQTGPIHVTTGSRSKLSRLRVQIQWRAAADRDFNRCISPKH